MDDSLDLEDRGVEGQSTWGGEGVYVVATRVSKSSRSKQLNVNPTQA